MPVLTLRDEASRTAWRVWPEPDQIPAGVVQEDHSYRFELSDADGADEADLCIDDTPLEALRAPAGRALWRWNPGFHAGAVEAELRFPGALPSRFEIVTDPDLRKLTRDDFDTMVGEILADTFALLSIGGFRKSVARGSGVRPPPIARLEYLRSRVDQIEEAVAAILRNPRRMLAAKDVTLPYHRALRMTGPEVLRSFRSGTVLHETATPRRLPLALKGRLPKQIRVRQRVSSFDLPEHRQIGACLRSWSEWLFGVTRMLERERPADDREMRHEAGVWAARARRLASRVGQLADAAPFAEAGEAPPRLVLTPVFRNDPPYRRFYRLWHEMNLGIAAVFGDFLNVPLARTFDLYELWCYLRLVHAATLVFGGSGLDTRQLFISDRSGSLTVATQSVVVAVGAGWKLCFQRRYREFWNESDGRGSYSRDMKPDVVVQQESTDATAASRMIVLDAKYRIDAGLNDALSSIHTYRDALVRELEPGKTEGIVGAAYLLTPHLPALLNDDYQKTSLPGRLFHPMYRAGFKFGAVTLRPGMPMEESVAALNSIIRDATGA